MSPRLACQRVVMWLARGPVKERGEAQEELDERARCPSVSYATDSGLHSKTRSQAKP